MGAEQKGQILITACSLKTLSHWHSCAHRQLNSMTCNVSTLYANAVRAGGQLMQIKHIWNTSSDSRCLVPPFLYACKCPGSHLQSTPSWCPGIVCICFTSWLFWMTKVDHMRITALLAFILCRRILILTSATECSPDQFFDSLLSVFLLLALTSVLELDL